MSGNQALLFREGHKNLPCPGILKGMQCQKTNKPWFIDKLELKCLKTMVEISFKYKRDVQNSLHKKLAICIKAVNRTNEDIFFHFY